MNTRNGTGREQELQSKRLCPARLLHTVSKLFFSCVQRFVSHTLTHYTRPPRTNESVSRKKAHQEAGGKWKVRVKQRNPEKTQSITGLLPVRWHCAWTHDTWRQTSCHSSHLLLLKPLEERKESRQMAGGAADGSLAAHQLLFNCRVWLQSLLRLLADPGTGLRKHPFVLKTTSQHCTSAATSFGHEQHAPKAGTVVQ